MPARSDADLRLWSELDQCSAEAGAIFQAVIATQPTRLHSPVCENLFLLGLDQIFEWEED